MSLPLAILLVAAFVLLLERAGLPRHAKAAADGARDTLRVIADHSLTDDAKERRLRREALRLFGLFGRIMLGTAVAAGVPLALLWTLDLLGVASLPDTLHLLARWDFILPLALFGTLAYFAVRRIRR